MHGDVPNKLTRKIHAEQCLALYSRLGLSAVQTSEPTSKTRGNTLLVLLLCNVSYRDNCIGIRIVSWKNISLQAYIPPLETVIYDNVLSVTVRDRNSVIVYNPSRLPTTWSLQPSTTQGAVVTESG